MLSANSVVDTPQLIIEVNHDYARTMNKIIFDKYLEENPDNQKELGLTLPPPENENKEAPEYGIVQVERDNKSKDFTEIFKRFCFKSLFIKEEVIKALQEVKIECSKAVSMELFTTKLSHPMRVEEFKHV